MALDPTLRDKLARVIHDAACRCGGPIHHRHYLTAADKAAELLTTQELAKVIDSFLTTEDAAQAVLDLIAARLPVWQPIEPGTVIKAGTVTRIEWDDRDAREEVARADYTPCQTDPARFYLDPRTVPAEPEDPRVELLAESLHDQGGCEERWPSCSISTLENYRNDARDLLARLDAARADS